MFWWFLETSLVVAILIVLVLALRRTGRLGPAVMHGLWLVVLLKFLVPPLVAWPWSISGIFSGLDWGSATPGQFAAAGGPAGPGSGLSEMVGAALQSEEEQASVGWGAPAPGEPGAAYGDLGIEGAVPPHPKFAVEAMVGPWPVSSGIASPATDVVRGGRDAAGVDIPRLFRRELVGSWLWAGWLGGVALTAFVQSRRVWRARRLIAQARTASPSLLREVACLADQFGIRAPSVRVIGAVRSPFVWCLGRPMLLWPASADTASDRWRGVLAHELAHLKRLDHWVAWLELVALCVWWWNPLFWFVRRQLEESAELACDAWAVWAVPGCRREYAEALVEVSQSMSRVAVPIPVLGVGTGARRAFQRRLTMILTEQVARRVSVAGLALIVLLALVAVPSLSREQRGNRQPVSRGSTDGADPTGQAPGLPGVGNPFGAMPGDPYGGISDDAQGFAFGGENVGTDKVVLLEIRNFSKPAAAGAMSSDGQRLASSRARPPSVELRDVGTGELLAATQTEHEPIALAFGPDGTMLAAGFADGEVLLLDGLTGSIERTLSAHNGAVTALMFSPDGDLLVSGGRDMRARVWDPHSGRELRSDAAAGMVHAVAFAPDGRTLAIASGENSEAGEIVVIQLRESGVAKLPAQPAAVKALAFSPDGKLLATGASDRTLRLWDLGLGKSLAMTTLADVPDAVAFGRNGKSLVVVSRGWTPFAVHVIEIGDGADLKTSQTIRPGGGRPLLSVFAPDGRLYVIQRPSAVGGLIAAGGGGVGPVTGADDGWMGGDDLGMSSAMAMGGMPGGMSSSSDPFAMSGPPEIRVFPLKHASAQDVQRIVQDIMPGAAVALAHDVRTNTVFVRASSDDLKNMASVIETLDVPTPKVDPVGGGVAVPGETQQSPFGSMDTVALRDGNRGRDLDVVALGTSYLEALGTLKLAKRKLERFALIEKSSGISSEEVATAQIELETAERKLDLLRSVAESALAAAQEEAVHAKRLSLKGYQAPGSVAAVDARLRILEMILAAKE